MMVRRETSTYKKKLEKQLRGNIAEGTYMKDNRSLTEPYYDDWCKTIQEMCKDELQYVILHFSEYDPKFVELVVMRLQKSDVAEHKHDSEKVVRPKKKGLERLDAFMDFLVMNSTIARMLIIFLFFAFVMLNEVQSLIHEWLYYP